MSLHPIARALRRACIAGLALLAVLLTPAVARAQDGAPTSKPVIRTEADLPRFSYPLPTGVANASDLLQNRLALGTVAAQVEADLEALLAGYTIDDAATRRGIESSLVDLAFLRGDADAALAHSAAARGLQEKPSLRLVSGLVTAAVVAAQRAGGDEAARHAAFREAYTSSIAALPWDVVQDDVEASKGRAETSSANLVLGFVQAQYDAAAASTGQISGDVARGLIGARVDIDSFYPYNADIAAVLTDYIAANRVVKPDIWRARDVTLSAADGLTPVVVCVWDGGVDASVFGDQMDTNPAETMDGRDDDGDGFVDDVHGIAYGTWGGEPSTELLLPISDAERERLGESLGLIKGNMDIGASLDTPEAAALRRRLAAMQPGDVQPFYERLGLLGGYIHGTHIGGIAVAGNPAARLLVVRETFPHEFVPPPITLEVARTWAANMQRSVDFMRQRGVRVVNMSWGATAKDIEDMYEANGLGATPEERQQTAQEAFDVLMTAMTDAMRSAPDILFVPAAGNSDGDVDFVVDLPASIDLPNVIVVGAVDQAGDEASFTSHGASVRVYASGVEVESVVPGGARLALSGTSMAAPQVTNLAAKLFALDPSITAARAAALITDGADRSADGRIALLNPARSVALLRGAE